MSVKFIRQKYKVVVSFFCLTIILFSYQHCGKKTVAESNPLSSSIATTAPTNVFVESASALSCPDGGIAISTYTDLNINGKFDESETILDTQNVCNGANGISGSSAGIFVESTANGSCPVGGIVVTTYIDKNNNTIFDSNETMTSKSNVCNGVNGTNGESTQLTVTNATTAQCPTGGSVFTTTSSTTEAKSVVICNGKSTTLSQKLADPSQCPTGGVVLTTQNDNSDPIFSVLCNGAKGETGATGANGKDGASAFITTSVANPFQCKNGGIVISTWVDATTPKNEVVCNGVDGTNGTNTKVTTRIASTAECSNGGIAITTTLADELPKLNVVCNGATGATGATGNAGASSPTYLTGYVGPKINGKNLSACHHDFLYFPPSKAEDTGWLMFRHQKNGAEDQGIGSTGFNVWNVDISKFSLVSEVGNVTYCQLTYDPKNLTLVYTVVDKTDGLQGKTGTISLK